MANEIKALNVMQIPATAIARGTGTDAFDKCYCFHCNVDANYQITDLNGDTAVILCNAGQTYWYAITNILSSTGTALGANDIILFR